MRGKRITQAIAREIFHATGLQKSIAHRFGVHQCHVSRIKAGKVRVLGYRVNQANIMSATLITLAFTGAA